MKKLRLFPAVLSGLLLLGLCACSSGLTAEDASRCVQVELDATYKGQFDGFVDFYSNVTTTDARSQYDNNVEGEAYNVLMALGPENLDGSDNAVEPDALQLHRAKELYEDIYAKSDYTVVSSAKQSDGSFSVKVTIRPLDVFQRFSQNYETGMADFWDKYDNVDTNAMSDDEFETWYLDSFVPDYYDALLDLLEAQIPDMDYLEETSIVIQVLSDEDGLYFSPEDWQNLDALIIDYT